MRDVFEIVPPVLKESAYGIGCTTWEVVRNVVLPYTKIGVIGGIMLGLGRALGETMAVTFIIGNAYRISSSLYEPGNSIASALANEFNEAADPVHRASLITLGLADFFAIQIHFVIDIDQDPNPNLARRLDFGGIRRSPFQMRIILGFGKDHEKDQQIGRNVPHRDAGNFGFMQSAFKLHSHFVKWQSMGPKSGNRVANSAR